MMERMMEQRRAFPWNPPICLIRLCENIHYRIWLSVGLSTCLRRRLCSCVCVCLRVCLCVVVYVYVSVCMCLCMCKSACVCLWLCVLMSKCLSVCLRACIYHSYICVHHSLLCVSMCPAVYIIVHVHVTRWVCLCPFDGPYVLMHESACPLFIRCTK